MDSLSAHSRTQVRIAMQFAEARPLNKPLDHRTRVGADRREKMRMRLVESAMLVFARHGAEGSVIDEVIRTAEVSRGTFYNYFRTNEELLVAVAAEVANQLLQIVDPVVRGQADPAARVAYGVRLTLKVAQEHPHLAAFLDRVGPPALSQQSLVTEVLPRDLAAGMASGRFDAMPPRLAFDLVTGPVLAMEQTAHDLFIAKFFLVGPPRRLELHAKQSRLSVGQRTTSDLYGSTSPFSRLLIVRKAAL